MEIRLRAATTTNYNDMVNGITNGTFPIETGFFRTFHESYDPSSRNQ